jgi:poly-gamma-glutamate capsule biosynthesis protein CapA/YwtB (metallophosphatase superfamily)
LWGKGRLMGLTYSSEVNTAFSLCTICLSTIMNKTLLFATCVLVILAVPALYAQESAPAADNAPPVAMTMALTGDSIITQRLSPYREPEFLRLIELIRGADVAFTNVEVLFHDYEGYPNAVSGGTYMRAEPALAKELAWAGFDLGSVANNHTGDYSVESLFSTARALRDAGIVHAGTGENLQQAREPRYADTAKGRVALVACSATFTPHSVAGRQRSDVKGRPGLSPLRFETKYTIDRATLDQLHNLAGKLGGEHAGWGGDGKSEVTFQGNRFVPGDRFAMVRTPLKRDLDEIAAAVRDGRSMARYAVVSMHCHEENPTDVAAPPDFFVAAARAMIDAGASVVVGQGEHMLQGVEIYKGKPIFYCLGNFIFQNDTVLRQPQENYDDQGLGLEARVSDFNAKRSNKPGTNWITKREYWESVVAEPKFVGDRLVAIRLYPVTLGYGKPSGVRGRPMLAAPEDADKILADLAKLSAPFGTTIENRGGVGYVVLPQ